MSRNLDAPERLGISVIVGLFCAGLTWQAMHAFRPDYLPMWCILGGVIGFVGNLMRVSR